MNPNPPNRSAIGRLVRQIRESRGLTRAQLARNAECNASVLTRIEEGHTVAPEPATLLKFERALEIEPGSLSKIAHGIGGHPLGSAVRLAIPHNVLSGPLIPLALQGDLADVSIASFTGFDSDPIWIPGKIRRPEDWSPPRYSRESNRCFQGAALTDLLEQKKADLIVAWRGLVSEWPEIFCRVAEISTGLSSCSAVIVSKSSAPDINFEKLPSNSPALFPTGILPLVHRFMKLANLTLRPRDIDFGDWPKLLSEVSLILDQSDYVLCFAWEPYLSWLVRDLPRTLRISDKTWLGLYFTQYSKAPVYTSLDIIARSDDDTILDWVQQQRDNNDGLFGRLKGYIRRIDNAIADPDESGAVLEAIAEYLDITAQTVAEELRRFELKVMFYD
jgi:transcriptional regulator with XRE-family HTH domain